MRRRPARASAALLAAFEADDRLHRLFRRHDLYLFWRYATDTRRSDALAAADGLRKEVRAARDGLRAAIVARDAAWLLAARRAEPRLARYAYFADTVRREAPHRLADGADGAVAALEPLLRARDYPAAVGALHFGTVALPDGAILRVGRDQSLIEAHADPAVRREGTRLLFAAYASRRDLFAHMLIQSVRGADALARLRGHASAFEEAAFQGHLPPGHLEAVLAAVAAQGAAYKAWQGRVGDPFASALRWRPSEAAADIAASAAALDPAYNREFVRLLDPRGGRADLGGGEHRLPAAGTASVYPTGASGIYMQAYQGTLLDLIVLAHESGHAVQAQLLYRSGAPVAYASGPGYFTESFGRFQELLLLDRLHRRAADPGARAARRDARAARMLAVFASAEEAAVERAIHRGVAAGSIAGADDLDSVTAAAGAAYSNDYERTLERRGLWMMSEGWFMAPTQELNDVYASLLAVRYFQLYRRDPRRFGAGYMALLSAGHDAPPAELLSRHLGLELMAPGFAVESVAVLLADVERLYAAGGS